MTSRPRAAQAKLAELEKASAPLEDQLLEAAKFVGIEIQDIQDSDGLASARTSKSNFHAREEWVLRWLLKKLQAGGDDGKEARGSVSSWKLLRYVITVIPSSSTARTLNERKFMTILRDTLEEARDGTTALPLEADEESSSKSKSHKKSKSSRKRNRSGEFLEVAGGAGDAGVDGLEAVWEVIEQILKAANSTKTSVDGRNSAFASEYMKSIFRTTCEEAARVLGAWLALCDSRFEKLEGAARTTQSSWLSPFAQIWASRAASGADVMDFTEYSLQPILSLLRRIDEHERSSKALKLDSLRSGVVQTNNLWQIQLEQLLALNVVIPSRVQGSNAAGQEVLKLSTAPVVAADPLHAPIIFLVAIRSLQSHGGRRRRANDTTWLQETFTALKDALGDGESSTLALQRLLQISVEQHVDLDLPQLRAITTQFGLSETVNWEIIAAVIKLDSNTFLIPDEDSHLLDDLLSNITKASVQENWKDLSASVVANVVVPLMSEFAKARDLTGFAHHWYAQLVLFDALRKDSAHDIEIMSAWEDEALQVRFRELMEASLTTHQITQLVEWLGNQVEEQPGAASLLICAIAGSVTREDISDTVELGLYNLVSKVISSDGLDARYRAWAWRVVEYTIRWASTSELSLIWSELASIIKEKTSGSGKNAVENLEVLVIFRVLSAFYTLGASDETIKSKSSKLLTALLKQVDEYLKRFVSKLKKDSNVGLEKCQSYVSAIDPGMGWYSYAYSSSIMGEYPKVLHIVADLKTDDVNILEKTFRIASATTPGSMSNNAWINTNSEAFPSLWASILSQETVLNDHKIIGHVLDVILDFSTNSKSSLGKSKSCNGFAVKCLSKLPLEALRRRDRELVMLSWDSEKLIEACDGAVLAWQMHCLDPAVLSLKARVMRVPTFYDGIKFQDLVDLAKSIEESDQDSVVVSPIFAELSMRVLGHVLSSLDQKRSKKYVSDAIEFLKKDSKTDTKEYATIKLIEVALNTLSAKISALEEAAIIDTPSLNLLRDHAVQTVPVFRETPGQLSGQPTSELGRSSIQKAVAEAIASTDEAGKQNLVTSLLHEGLADHTQLNKLLALRHAVAACEDVRDTDDSSSDPTNIISTTYSTLSDALSHSDSVRQFCLVSEIMALILRIKPRTITQWNIDSTLSAITITCSRLGPSLSPRCSGAIYTHLCRLLQAILTSHRVKLQGHFHLLVQTLQALLRCLFTPLPHASARITALHPQPPWLSAANPLGAKHAALYTRLLTLVANPSVSSVRQKNALVSATDKAKRMAGQFLPVVLSTYIRLQLEMKMSSQCREVMVPGLYAVFDTTTVESRRVLGESLDSSGRAVLGGLVRDYLRFGKWNGS